MRKLVGKAALWINHNPRLALWLLVAGYVPLLLIIIVSLL